MPAIECAGREAIRVARADTRNSTKYWWDPHVSGLSLMCADFTSHDYAAHTHDAFVIAVTEAGGAQVRSRGVVEAASPSRLFVSNPEEPQSSWMGASRRWRYRSLYLTQPSIDVVARGLGVGAVPHFTSNFLADAGLTDRFAVLHRALEGGGDRFREHELLIGTFGHLFCRHGSGGGRIERAPRDRTIVRKVADMMLERLADTLLLEDLAATAGLTVFQLIGVFKRTIGTTPHVYLTHVRLNAACRLLRRGSPIAEAATASGFCDQSALTKHFKRCYGMTPLQFAKAATVTRGRRSVEPGTARL
jgi:AraC-like DNA-binding protein